MRPSLSVVTIGVADLARSMAFYRALGFPTESKVEDGVGFFRLSGVVLAVWSRDALAEYVHIPSPPAPGAMSLAHNVGSREEVHAVFDEFVKAGATVAHAPREEFWGGYGAVVRDPDGHPWEIVHNPHWGMESDGRVRL